MSTPASSCKCDDPSNYQYWIYAALGVLVVASESLGITKRIKSNSIVQLIVGLLPKNKVEPEPAPVTQVQPANQPQP